MLKISEIFHSISGESISQGLPAVFLRLAGCNLSCTYCDTEYARHGTYKEFTIEDAASQCLSFGIPLLIITGGEPLLQEMAVLQLLQACRSIRSIQLETNGTMPIDRVVDTCSVVLDVKTPGAGASAPFLTNNLAQLKDTDDIKFVVTDNNDLSFAAEFSKQYNLFDRPNPPIISPATGYITPQDAADWLIETGFSFRLQLQLHKILWGIKTRR